MHGRSDLLWEPSLRNALLTSLRIVLGLVFLASGVTKLDKPYELLSSVLGYDLVNPKVAVIVAATLPWAELTLAVCLLAGRLLCGASLVSFFLGLTFTLALACALYRHLEIHCGCFGDSGEVSGVALVRSLALCAGAGLCCALSWSRVEPTLNRQLLPCCSSSEGGHTPKRLRECYCPDNVCLGSIWLTSRGNNSRSFGGGERNSNVKLDRVRAP
jgi:uncharacterized membrane protein YphA (DoxX/SURF4 family)